MYVSVSTDGRVVPSLGWHTSPQLGPEEKGDQSTIAIGIEVQVATMATASP